MRRLVRAHRARREQLRQLTLERQRAMDAVHDLRAQYRAAPWPALLLAAGAGGLLGWRGADVWKPLMSLYPGARWGMMVARGWLR